MSFTTGSRVKREGVGLYQWAPMPGQRFGFVTLERAQAAGDLQALWDGGRRAGRVGLDDLGKVMA